MEKRTTYYNERLDKQQEACGVFGILAPRKNVSKITYYGLMALQHRGQESAGICTFDSNFCKIHKNMGLVHNVFNDNILNNLEGHIAIGHTRYSTMGDSNISNAQPFIIDTKIGKLALAHNGNLVNAVKLRKYLINKGIELTTTSDIEIMANIISEYLEQDLSLEEALSKGLSECIGSFSVLIATNDKLIAAKDPFGIRPLCLGITVGGDFVIASESCALNTAGANFVREINPGEITIIDIDKKLNSFYYYSQASQNLCLFELIYFSRPDSILYNSSVYNFRFNLGKELAKTNTIDADIVIPIPDSGTISAIGFSYESKIPFAKGLIKNRNIGRTFIQPTPELRELDIQLKLNPIKDIVKDKKIIIVDDSIVRGTTSQKIIKLLKNNGAKEVHMRISSAPIKYPCFYGIDTDSKEQLIASKHTIKEISDFIGADSLEYLTIESMLKTCEYNNNFCTACFN
ncbi:MAG: amidophosphoribosyltransferase, partial [Vampirovibrionia bacterium]